MDIKSLLNSEVASSKNEVDLWRNGSSKGPKHTRLEAIHSPRRYVQPSSATPMNEKSNQSDSLTCRHLNTRVTGGIPHLYPNHSNPSETSTQNTRFPQNCPRNIVWRVPSYIQSSSVRPSSYESQFPNTSACPPRELPPSIPPEVRFENMSIQNRKPSTSSAFLEKSNHRHVSQEHDEYRPSSTEPSNHEGEEVLEFDLDHQPNERASSTSTIDDAQGDRKCYHADKCILKSEDRKVVSQFFGRNKACTRAIPDHLYGNYCRKHYQRTKYRAQHFGVIQMDLVRKALEKMQDWGGITEFEFALRLRARKLIENQDNHQRACEEAQATRRPLPPPHPDTDVESKERFLVPYLGKHKSFDDMFDIVDMIEEHIEEHKCNAPEIEILPSFRPGFEKPKKQAQRNAAKPAGVQKSKSKAPVSPRSRVGNLLSNTRKTSRRQSGPIHSTREHSNCAGHRKGRSI